jgi:hypothetical protein
MGGVGAVPPLAPAEFCRHTSVRRAPRTLHPATKSSDVRIRLFANFAAMKLLFVSRLDKAIALRATHCRMEQRSEIRR